MFYVYFNVFPFTDKEFLKRSSICVLIYCEHSSIVFNAFNKTNNSVKIKHSFLTALFGIVKNKMQIQMSCFYDHEASPVLELYQYS